MERPERYSSELNTLDIFGKLFEDKNYMGGYRMPNSILWLPRIWSTANLSHKLGALATAACKLESIVRLPCLGWALLYLTTRQMRELENPPIRFDANLSVGVGGTPIGLFLPFILLAPRPTSSTCSTRCIRTVWREWHWVRG